jgi:hypothetical protein
MVYVGDTVHIMATFTDPGPDDTHTALIDWGDGVVEAGVVDQNAGTVTGSHVYDEIGVYIITVEVIDDDGGSGSDTLTILVKPICCLPLPFLMVVVGLLLHFRKMKR